MAFVSLADMTDSMLVDVNAFLGGKTKLVRRLATGDCGGRYEDAILILSSVFAAFSSQFWPRRGDYPWDETEIICAASRAELDEIRRREKQKWQVEDKKRFVEFWATYADPSLKSVHISVPLLAHSALRAANAVALEQLQALRPRLLRHAPRSIDWSIATVDDDADEMEVATNCPALSLATIRRFSYPAVFYREVRSAYVHALSPGKNASPVRGGESGAAVTYRNFGRPPHHRIYFEIEWLCRVAESAAERAFADWQRSSKRCTTEWWLDGA